MIRGTTQHPEDGTPVVLIGLEMKDLEQMVGDEQPRVLALRSIDPSLPDAHVWVFYATEEGVEAMKQKYQTTREGEPNGNSNRRGRRRGR